MVSNWYFTFAYKIGNIYMRDISFYYALFENIYGKIVSLNKKQTHVVVTYEKRMKKSVFSLLYFEKI